MSDLKSVLQERKIEKPQNQFIKKEDLEFSNEIFINNEPEINEFLIIKTIEATTIQSKASLGLGKLFTEVFEKLSGNNKYDGLYEKWIEMSGFNKRTALRHRNRFELYGKVNEDKRSLIAILPVRLIEEIYGHEDISTCISMINEGATRDQLEELLFEINKTPKVIEYDKDELESGILNKMYIFDKLKNTNMKKLDDSKKKKIENYLRKIEEILG